MPKNSYIKNTRIDIYVSMHHGCPFGYSQMNGFLGMDITMEIAWILKPGDFTPKH